MKPKPQYLTGETILHIAVVQQDVELVEWMLAKGASITARHSDPQTKTKILNPEPLNVELLNLFLN